MPWDIKSASLKKFSPPWTVKRQIWMDALKPHHSASPTTMDQYIAANEDPLLGDPSDLHLLLLPLLPVPVADASDPVSVGTPSVGEPVLVPLVVPPDFSQGGPFDVDQGRGTL